MPLCSASPRKRVVAKPRQNGSSPAASPTSGSSQLPVGANWGLAARRSSLWTAEAKNLPVYSHGGICGDKVDTARLRALFQEVDTDGTGAITEAELASALEKLRLSGCAEKARQMIQQADANHNQKLEFVEFVAAMRSNVDSQLWKEYALNVDYHAASKVGTQEVFKKFDRDNSGSIGRSEFRSVCHALEPGMEEGTIEEALLELDTDGDGEISLSEFKTWWEAMMAGKAHFASIAVRNHDQIFKTNRIREVIEEGGKKLVCGLPLGRWVGTIAFLATTLLNAVNIIKGFTRNLPKQSDLMNGLRDGSLAATRNACGASMAVAGSSTQSSVTNDHHVTDDCTKYEEKLESVYVTVLVAAELALVIVYVGCFVFNFAPIVCARTDARSVANQGRWTRIADSFEWLGAVSSASALKILPRVKDTPGRLVAQFKIQVWAPPTYQPCALLPPPPPPPLLCWCCCHVQVPMFLQKARLTQDDGEFDATDKLYLFGAIVSSLFTMVVMAFAGIIALHLKLLKLKTTLDIPIGHWGASRWIAFLGFANQIAGLVPLNR
jgi:Ca2+-binding EF-hand superfamily protein